MQIDLQRWTSLLGAAADARSDLRACTDNLRAAQERWAEIRSRRELLAADPAHRSSQPDVASAAGQSLREADLVFEAARAAMERVQQRQDALAGRFGELSSLRRACLAWARRTGVSLPGAGDEPATVAVSEPAGYVRHFGGDLGPTAPAASPAAPSAEASAGQSRRGFFHMGGRLQ